jgi:hypothetical protein
MRFRIQFLAPLALALVVFGFLCAPPQARAAVRASVYVDNLYYDELDPYGDWNYVADYGWCWSPGYVSAGWRPYTVGYWAYSDWGWVWVSEDPWGDWPYHYGRWAFDASYGWVWVPGDVWAPAWVSWRYGSDWVGWAPLPPDVDWSYGIGIRYSSSSLDRRIVSGGWCFVTVNDFASRRIRGRVLPVSRNVTLIQETRNVTRYVDVNSRPVERGLRVDMIERATGKRIPRYEITERSVGGRGGVQVRGRTIQVSKPTRAVVRTANTKLQSLPRDRAERGRAVRENENASRRQNDTRMRNDRQRRDRDAEVRSQRNLEQQERRSVQQRSQRVQEQRTQVREQRRQNERSQMREQQAPERQPRQERPSQQARERRPRQERSSSQVQEQRPRQERPSPQAQEQRPSQDRRSRVEEQQPKQERRSQQAPPQRRKQDQERERRGRGGGGT